MIRLIGIDVDGTLLDSRGHLPNANRDAIHEAVAAGMCCAARLAVRTGLIPDELAERQERLLARFELPVAPKQWDAAELIRAMRSDKKSLARKLRFILPKRLGDVALFLSGVLPDHTATHPYSPTQREWIAQSADLGLGEVLLVDDGLRFIEAAGAGWYRKAVEHGAGSVSTGPSFLKGLADRFSEARRILNYLADRYLFRHDLGLVTDLG